MSTTKYTKTTKLIEPKLYTIDHLMVSYKMLQFIWISNPRWPPSQDKDWQGEMIWKPYYCWCVLLEMNFSYLRLHLWCDVSLRNHSRKTCQQQYICISLVLVYFSFWISKSNCCVIYHQQTITKVSPDNITTMSSSSPLDEYRWLWVSRTTILGTTYALNTLE